MQESVDRRQAGAAGRWRRESQSQAQPSQHVGTLSVRGPSLAPIVWTAISHVAGSAWNVLQLATRHVLAPTATWVLRQVKLYIEEQIAIQRAMARPCPVPAFTETEVREATDNLGLTHRAIGTPYGMVVYLTRLQGRDVVVRWLQLNKVADVGLFWAEAEAGRALTSAPGGTHSHIVPYLGCCPTLTCHVYEQRSYTCTLRDALQPAGRYGGLLGGWEARLAVGQQVVAAVAHLVRSGVVTSDLVTGHIILQLGDHPPGAGPGGGLQCWLAPGCGFRLLRTTAPEPRPGHPSRNPAAAAVRAAGTTGPPGQQEGAKEPDAASVLSDMARSLGHVLMQLLGAPDLPPPAPSAVLRALADVEPGRLLAHSVSPPLTDDQAWPLLAAVYPLLVWGDNSAGRVDARPSTDPSGHPGLPTAAGTAAAASAARAAAAAPGGRAGTSSASNNSGGSRSNAGGGPGSGGRSPQAGGAGEAAAVALRGHLLREVAPVLEDLLVQLRLLGVNRASPAAAPAPVPTGSRRPPVASVPAAGSGGTATVGTAGATTSGRAGGAGGGGAGPAAAEEENQDVFAGASAPPLPMHPDYPPILSPSAGGGSDTDMARPHAHFWPPPPPPPPPTSPPPAMGHSVPRVVPPHQQAAGGPGASPLGSSSPACPPAELLCPITQELMEDPVVAADGHSYERAAVVRWFAGRASRPTSPLTGAVLPHTHVTPNYALRKIIADWRERHGAEDG